MQTEIQRRADFSIVRYANCWEDATILLKALEPQERKCLSIGSAGDNSFSLLAAGAEHVTIVEMNPAQIACINLRRAGYTALGHRDFLILLGELDQPDPGYRMNLYQSCRAHLDESSRDYWDHFIGEIESGFGRIGKFEKYFTIFRRKILPLVHRSAKVGQLLEKRGPDERERFYESEWNTPRWRFLFRVFFSRFVMGKLGRDPEFFKYVEGSVSDRILTRTRHALVNLDPSENPYLKWILTGRFGDPLPHALRADNFEKIRDRIDRVSILSEPIEAALETPDSTFEAFNLSDIFEYMSSENAGQLLEKIHSAATPGARLAYWNMLAPRSRPDHLSKQLIPLEDLSEKLFAEDRAFFYSNFIVEETS